MHEIKNNVRASIKFFLAFLQFRLERKYASPGMMLCTIFFVIFAFLALEQN